MYSSETSYKDNTEGSNAVTGSVTSLRAMDVQVGVCVAV